MTFHSIIQIVLLVLVVNAISFGILFLSVKLKNPKLIENQKRIDKIEKSQLNIISKLNEIMNCIENIASSTVAGVGNIEYIMNQYILKDEDVKEKSRFVKRLGSSSLNTRRATLELRLLYKDGTDLISAAQQLSEKYGDANTINKFDEGINVLEENTKKRIILEAYRDMLVSRINRELD